MYNACTNAVNLLLISWTGFHRSVACLFYRPDSLTLQVNLVETHFIHFAIDVRFKYKLQSTCTYMYHKRSLTHVPVLKAGHPSVLFILCLIVCVFWVGLLGLDSLLFFLYDYLSYMYVVCYTLVLSCRYTCIQKESR